MTKGHEKAPGQTFISLDFFIPHLLVIILSAEFYPRFLHSTLGSLTFKGDQRTGTGFNSWLPFLFYSFLVTPENLIIRLQNSILYSI